MWLGDIRLGDTIDVKFCTVSTTGAPTTLAGTPVVSAYPGNSTTELTAGITLTVDFDARTGLHNVRVVASGANGYLTATNYALVITTGTVGGTSAVGYVIGSFSIENRSAVMPTTAGRTLDIAAGGEAGIDLDNTVGTLSAAEIPNLDAAVTTRLAPTVAGRTLDVSAGGEAGLDWANVGSPATAQNLSATNIDVDQVVASVSGAVGSVTGAVGSVAAGGITAASIATDAIGSDELAATAANKIRDTILSDAITFAGANINATISSRATPAQVNTEVVDAMNVDTYAEPGQIAPPATATIVQRLQYLYKSWRNRSTQTATQYSLYGDDATTLDQKAAVSDNGTTFDKNEVGSGP